MITISSDESLIFTKVILANLQKFYLKNYFLRLRVYAKFFYYKNLKPYSICTYVTLTTKSGGAITTIYTIYTKHYYYICLNVVLPSIKCFNNEIDKLLCPNIDSTSLSNLEAL